MPEFHIQRTRLGFDTRVIVTARYTGGGRLNRETLWPALAEILQHHRALSTQVHDASSKHPTFVYLGSVNLSKVVRFHDVDDRPLDAILDSYLLRPFEFETALPLWEMGVLQDNTVIFTYQHAIGDGQSGLAFHRLLLSALNSDETPLRPLADIVPIPDTLELVAPLEKMTKLSVPFSLACYQYLKIFAPVSWRKLGSAWTGNNVPRDKTAYTMTRLWDLTPDQTTKLMCICRDQKSTLTSFAHTAVVVVVSSLLDRAPKRHKYLCTEIPVSLRRFTGVPATELCDHVSMMYFYPPLINFPEISRDWKASAILFPWDVSARMVPAMRKKIAKSRGEPGSLKLLFGRIRPYLESKMGKKRDGTLTLSNLGPFPPPSPEESYQNLEEERWFIDQMFFAQGDPILAPAISLGIVGAESGSLSFCWNWGKDGIEDEFMEEVVEGFKQLVGAVLKYTPEKLGEVKA
ncbi:unnamed protein product [Somion occarium]|uniref:Alcohol acetyltransferase n=1 Tax=Somion occarium TaxID=3059160 RepID=A0ABP1E2M6_9APHY